MNILRTVDRDTDVFQKPRFRECRERIRSLIVDDRAVCREIAAGVALVLEEIEDIKNVLSHKDLTTCQINLKSYFVWKCGLKCVERQLFAPLSL